MEPWTPTGSCRLTPKPIRWDYLQDSTRKKLHDVYASLLKLRANYPALATGATNYSLNGSLKYLGVQTDSLSVMVVGNFDVLAGAGAIPFPVAGTWFDYLTPGDSVQAGASGANLTFAPGEYHVFTNRNLNGSGGPDTGTTVTPPPPPSSSSLSLSIYPNPVISSAATITYNLPTAANVSLVVYSISGRRLGVIDLGSRGAGQYTLLASQLPVDPIGMPNGYYILEMITSNGTMHLPFLVVH